jgi:hypothetical protein
MSAEEPGGVVEARGHHVPIRNGFGTQGSAEVVIDLHWTIQIIKIDHPAMQSHKGNTSGKLEETEHSLHEGAQQARSIPIREDLLYSRH